MILSIYILCQVLALIGTGQAISTAPVEPLLSAANGNHTILNTRISPSWVSNAGVRGTSDILWSCILTLAACVYTAIHLNVPPKDVGRWKFLWRKSKWVALALFAPEIVLYCAFTQLREAWKLIKERTGLRGPNQAAPAHPEGPEPARTLPDAPDPHSGELMQLNELRTTQHASPDQRERHESALTLPNTPNSYSKDDFKVTDQEPRVSITQQDQALSETSHLPLSERSGVETAKDDDSVPISEHGAEGQTSHHPSQQSLSILSKRKAGGKSPLEGSDLEKGIVST